MSDLAERRQLSKLHAVETRAARIYPSLRLPARLADLSSRARARVGSLLDDGRIRYLLDDDGAVVVVWSARA
jgi:hypothetical protein